MLNLILTLIDRCIALGKRKEELNRQLFNDFVEPAFSDFETVHINYIETFHKYRESIKMSDDFLNPKKFLEQVRVDNLFSASERAKLWELEKLVADSVFGKFMLLIIRYLRFDPDWEPVIEAAEGGSIKIEAEQCIATYAAASIAILSQDPNINCSGSFLKMPLLDL